MKTLAFLLALLPGIAFAQVGPEVYKPATGAQILAIDTTPRTITNPFLFRMARLVCTVSCYISINPRNISQLVTTTTGVFLPSLEPVIFRVVSGAKITAITVNAVAGVLHVLELTR